jgi:hypothetical protein
MLRSVKKLRWSVKAVAVTFALAMAGSLAAAQAPAYFVKADMVRGAEGAMGPVCVPNALFFGGEKVVFRAVVYDAATGEELKFEEIQARGITARVVIDSVDPVGMFYPPPAAAGAEAEEEGPPPGADFFRGPWVVPADFPAGVYTWHIEVTDAAGNTGSFEPIGAQAGLPSLIIQPPAN